MYLRLLSNLIPMKKNIFLFLFLFSFLSMHAQYASQNISLYANWDDASVLPEPTYGIRYNSVWGYAQNDREYAILGATSGTYFIDVTTPTSPVQNDFVPGKRSGCIWREYKTYGKYLYAVSDDQKPNSLQIIDMSYLPDSVHVVYDSNNLLERAHTLFIDGNYLYCGSVTTVNGAYYSMAVYSLSNPLLPAFIRNLYSDDPSFPTVHDMYVRHDTVYASCGYDALHMYHFNGSVFSSIGDLVSYPDKGYNHSSALTADGKTLIFTDEVPASMSIKAIDVSDMSNIKLQSTFFSNVGATAHNPFIMGNNVLVVAYYQDGLQMYDIGDPKNPVTIGYFDTYPQNGNVYTSPAYAGCWGAYVDLPSQNILASDMQNGLFVLNAHGIIAGIENKSDQHTSAFIYPENNGTDLLLGFNSLKDEKASIRLYDMAGRELYNTEKNILAGKNRVAIENTNLSAGMYLLTLDFSGMHSVLKFVK